MALKPLHRAVILYFFFQRNVPVHSQIRAVRSGYVQTIAGLYL